MLDSQRWHMQLPNRKGVPANRDILWISWKIISDYCRTYA